MGRGRGKGGCSAGWLCCEVGACVGCCAASEVCAACGCDSRRYAKIFHVVLIMASFLSAILFAVIFDFDESGFPIETGCKDGYFESCRINQLIYRVSAALMLLFASTMIGSYFAAAVHNGLFMLKLSFVWLLAWWFCTMTDHGFDKLVHTGQWLALGWLLLQSLLVLEYAHQLHDKFVGEMSVDEPGTYTNAGQVKYLLTTLLFAGVGALGMYHLYEHYAGCSTGWWLVNTTLGANVLLAVGSVTLVDKGVLVPSVLFAYTVYLNWYAMLSSDDESCNPTADSTYIYSVRKMWGIVITVAITAASMGYVAWTGTSIISLFSGRSEDVPNMVGGLPPGPPPPPPSSGADLHSILAGETDENTPLKGQPTTGGAPPGATDDADGGPPPPTPPTPEPSCCSSICEICCSMSKAGPDSFGGESREEVAFFHLLMLINSFYMVQILTSWGRTDGAPEADGSDNSAAARALWIKILAEWACFLYYAYCIKGQFDADNGDKDKKEANDDFRLYVDDGSSCGELTLPLCCNDESHLDGARDLNA